MNTKTMIEAAVPERRPMFTRQWSLSRHLTGWLVAKGVSPNSLSLAGMTGAVVAGLALAATSQAPRPQTLFWVAVAGIIVRGMGNLLDGMVAVSAGKASPLGELYNEVPDRVSDIAILVGAGYAAGGDPTLGLLAALVAVFVAYIRAEGKVVGGVQHYCGPMAKPGRMLVVVLIALYCGATPAAWQPRVLVGGHGFGLMAAGLVLMIVGGVVTVVRRLRRIARDVAGKRYHLAV